MRGARHGFGSDLQSSSRTATVFNDSARALVRRHRTEIFVRIVFRLPTLDVDRPVFANRVRGQPGFKRSQVDERLERRSRLAFRRNRAIELAFGIIASANQRADRTAGIERNDRALRHAEFLALFVEFIRKRSLRGSLNGSVERRGYDYVLIDRPDRVVQTSMT